MLGIQGPGRYIIHSILYKLFLTLMLFKFTNTCIFSAFSPRLESTDIPQGAWDRLAKIVETLKVDREKLDINYMPYAHVVEKRNITNAI